MRYWELCEEREQSLRQLNARKHEELRVLRSEEERGGLLYAMYVDAKRELEMVELEKAQLELEQQRIELARSRAEAESMGIELLSNRLVDGTQAEQERKAAIARTAITVRKRRREQRLQR